MFDIPVYVPEVLGFWGVDGYNIFSNRLRWLRNNIVCDGVKRLFGCWCARSVLHFYEESYPDGYCLGDIIEMSERFAFGEVTSDDLELVRDNSYDVISFIYAANSYRYDVTLYASYAVYYAGSYSSSYAGLYTSDASVDVFRISGGGDVACGNQNRALSLFMKPDNVPDDETLRLLCRYWYYENRNLFFPIIDRLIELGLEDYRVRLMDERPECYRLGMWPFTPEMIK